MSIFQVQTTKNYAWLQVHLKRRTGCNNVTSIGMVGIFFRLYRTLLSIRCVRILSVNIRRLFFLLG